MTKQTTTILGVGALAIVGYLVYKQMSKNKPASFANFRGAAAPLARCRKSPHERVIGVTTDGRSLYECCSPGVTAFAPSKQRCDSGTVTGSQQTTLDSTFTSGRGR